jgi:hypothetical protein
MIGFLPALRVQEFCEVVGVLVGIIEGVGALVMPFGDSMSLLFVHEFKSEVQVGYLSLPGKLSRWVQRDYIILSL